MFSTLSFISIALRAAEDRRSDATSGSISDLDSRSQSETACRTLLCEDWEVATQLRLGAARSAAALQLAAQRQTGVDPNATLVTVRFAARNRAAGVAGYLGIAPAPDGCARSFLFK
jgi:hypothetical protein